MLIEIATDKKMLCKSLPSIWKADFFRLSAGKGQAALNSSRNSSMASDT